METKKDIERLEDIRSLVDSFYGRVRRDVLIGGIFEGVIKDWPLHLGKMYRFWQTVLLDQHTYQGSPFPPHARMPLERQHFDAWLRLWTETVDELFVGPKADDAKWRASKMAEMFLSKITYFRNDGTKPLI